MSESDKLRRDIQQGPAPRTYDITIDPEVGVSPEETRSLERSLNRSSPTSAFRNEQPQVGPISAFSIMNKDIPSMGDTSAVAWQIATVKSAIDPTQSLKDHYTWANARLDIGEHDAVVDEVVAEYKAWYNQLTADLVNDIIDNGVSADLINLGTDVNEMMKETGEVLSGPDALEHAAILSIKGRVDRNQAERNYYLRKLHGVTSGLSTLENIGNFADLLLPDWIKDATDLTGGSPINVVNDLQDMMHAFQSKPQAERLIFFNQLLSDTMEAADGNELKAIARMMEFIDPSAKGFLAAHAILDVVDVALIAAPMVFGLAKALKANNAIRLVKDSGGSKVAGDINAGVLADETEALSKVTGVDRDIAAANTSPFEFQAHGLAEATDGIALDTVRALEEVAKVQRSLRPELQKIAQGKERLSETSLTPLETKLVEDKALKSYDDLQEHYWESFGYWPESAKILSRDPANNSFTVGMKLGGMDFSRSVTYSMSDTGTFNVLEAGAITTKIWSPNTWMNKMSTGAVEVATRIGFTQLKVADDLRKAANLATKGLGSRLTPKGSASRKRVDDVLLAMANANKGKGKVFSIAEMKSPPYNLSDQEIASTFAIRDIFDTLHFMKNLQIRNTRKFEGFMEASLRGEKNITGPIQSVQARPYEEFSHIPSNITGDKKLRLWYSGGNKGQGNMVDAFRINLKKKYEEGYQLVRLHSREQFGNELTDFALVRKTSLSELRMDVLNYQTAYIPKITKDGFYFVKQSLGAMVNGRAVRAGEAGAQVRTVRMFDNRRDAELYADGLRKSTTDPITGKGLDSGKVKYDVKHDRELTATQRENEIINTMGGMFASPRASHIINYGLHNDTPRTVSAFEAMQRNISHVAANIPINNFRMGMQKRWLNSTMDDSGKPLISTPGDFNSTIIAEAGSKAEVALRESRNWIKDQMRIPTEGEIRWEGLTRRIAEWMEGKPILDTKIPFSEVASIRRMTQIIGHKDPFSAMRGSAFHLLLGWFNPIQLWVQSQGATIAMSLHPIQGIAATREYMALRAGMYLRGAGKEAALRKTAKAAGLDEQDFLELVEQFNKTGLMQSVKSTADYNAAAQGYWTGAQAIRDIADKGLFMFREGETFVRGVSFSIARTNWKKANPGKTIGDLELKQILDDSVSLTMNMNRANRAHWQKGIWSIPTQFQQVTAKFIENMMPNLFPGSTKRFTAAEKGRVMAGQVFLYGAAGVPMGKWISEEIAHMRGVEPGDIDVGLAATIKGGFWSWLSEETLGVGFDFGERGAFADGITNLVESMIRDDIPIHSFLGPFKTVPTRMVRAFKIISPMVLNFDDLEITPTEAVIAFTAVASIVSTGNNLHTAITWWNMKEVRDGKGNLLFNVDTDAGRKNWMLVGKALGINPTRISDHFNTKGFVKNHKEFKRKKLDDLKLIMLQYYGTGKFTDADSKNFRIKEMAVLSGLNEMEVKSIQRSFADWLTNSKEQEAEFILKALAVHMESGDSNIGGKGILYNSNLARGVDK